MRSTQVILLSILALANAAIVPRTNTYVDHCPPVWLQVKAELNTLFATGVAGTPCNDLARAAIRASFHDCGTWDLTQGKHGGCDGSLILGVTPDIELNRSENRGLQKIAVVIQQLAKKYGTSVADMIVFAGSKFPTPWTLRVIHLIHQIGRRGNKHLPTGSFHPHLHWTKR